MRLQDTKQIELSGYEVATALGIFRYINDYKEIAKQGKPYLQSLIKKFEQLRDAEL